MAAGGPVEARLPLWMAALRLALLAPAVSAFVLAPFMGHYVLFARLVSLVGAVVFGAPALWTARRSGVRSAHGLAAVGALAGALPFALIAAPFLIRWGGVDRVFITYVTFGAICGALTALVYWLLFHANNWSSRSVVAGVAGVVLAGWLVVGWPQAWWPKTRQSERTVQARWAFGDDRNEAGTREVRIWYDDKPDCVARLFLPALSERLRQEPAASVDLRVRHISEWGYTRQTHLVKVADVDVPASQTFLQSCLPWR